MSYYKYGPDFLKGIRRFRVEPRLEASVIEKYLCSLDCPRSLTVYLLWKSGEHRQLAELGFDPLVYSNVDELKRAYCATKFLSKWIGLKTGLDLEEVALVKFFEFEELCRSTNRRFRDLSRDSLYKGSQVWLHHAVTRKIEQLLGAFDIEEFFSMPDWGPGASTLIKRRDASSATKFQYETGVTRDLFALLPTDLMEKIYPLWVRHLLTGEYPCFQVGSKVITVPKDASTDRVIAIEPGINLWFQKSLGTMINRRLRRVGIDLTDQSRNQTLAKLGSQTGQVATVDLSSASDSISQSVVEALLPPLWYSVLDSCRTKYGSVGRSNCGSASTLVRWEKFSSMGNGFTFSLESLLFYAVAFCCTEYLHADTSKVSVYGDDVIVPTSVFALLSECLEFYGFRVNRKKSHYDSLFRESCGAHFCSGIDVKPIYLKDRILSIPAIIRTANAVRRLAFRSCNYMACDKRFRATFELLVHTVPKGLRLWVPEGFGDGGFVSNFDEAAPVRATKRKKTPGWEGFSVPLLVESSLQKLEEGVGYSLASLWDLSKRDESLRPVSSRPLTLEAMFDLDTREVKKQGRNFVPLHQTRIRVVQSVVRQWPDLGPWV
jgi:hypothetical protein